MFIALEDEGANANIIVWLSVFENNRGTILSASMLACQGKVRRASGVIHLIVESVSDLKTVFGLDVPFPLVAGRGDEARQGGGPAANASHETPKLPARQPLHKGALGNPPWPACSTLLIEALSRRFKENMIHFSDKMMPLK
jgi:DNA polymerase III alpha subunit